MFDVIEVDEETMRVRLMGENKSERNAEAIEKMAIIRRANGYNFFVTVPAGTYKDGDEYRA